MDQTMQTSEENGVNDPHAVLLEWSAPTHPVHERSGRWYVIGALLILSCVAFGIISGNWTLSLLAGLIGGTYFLARSHPPVIRRIAIGEHGFRFDARFIHWDECEDFWVVETPQYGELHIRKRKGFDRELIIQTADIDRILLRATLSRFLPVRPDQQERLLDMLTRILKL